MWIYVTLTEGQAVGGSLGVYSQSVACKSLDLAFASDRRGRCRLEPSAPMPFGLLLAPSSSLPVSQPSSSGSGFSAALSPSLKQFSAASVCTCINHYS